MFARHRAKTLIALSSLLLLALLLVAEKLIAWLRPPVPAPSPTDRYIRLSEHPPSKTAFVTPSIDSDSLEHKQYRLQIDGDGYIWPSKVHADPDLVLAFLGGSTTECMLVEEDKRFPCLVGALLAPDFGKVNSYNCGVAGAHSLNSIDTLLNKVLGDQPDVVAMMHNVNDLVILMYEGTYWSKNPYKRMVVNRAEPPDTLWSLGKRAVKCVFPNLIATLRPPTMETPDPFASLRGRKLVIDPERLRAEFRSNLVTFVAICRARDVTPVLLTQASRLKDDPDPLIRHHTDKMKRDFGLEYERYRELWAGFNDIIRQVGEEQGVWVVDLAARVPKEKEFMYDICHFNTRGSELVAQIIAGDLREQGIAVAARDRRQKR